MLFLFSVLLLCVVAIYLKFKFFCDFTLTDRIVKQGSVSAGESTKTANMRKGSYLSSYLLGMIYLFPRDY